MGGVRQRRAGGCSFSQVLYKEERNLLPEALAVINAEIAEFPAFITLVGTRGGIHFELGNYDEALHDLRRCNDTSESPFDRGISSAFLAAIASRSGDTKSASRYAQTARKRAGDHALVKRLLASIEPRDTSAPTRA
jgi:hypothetical protein